MDGIPVYLEYGRKQTWSWIIFMLVQYSVFHLESSS